MRALLTFLGSLYALVWMPTAGRPWTYEIRDWSERHKGWAYLIGVSVTGAFVTGQAVLPQMVGMWALPFIGFADFMAFVAGHLFWDTHGVYIHPHEDFRK